MFVKARLVPLLALCLPLVLAGCRIEAHTNGDKKDDVDIGTPFGSLKVKTDDSGVLANLGLTPYPGATLVKKHGDDDGSADVNMSFGSFKLGVHAAEMRSSDPSDKVLAFYRKDLGRYGTVIECRGDTPVGEPTRTALGLSCTEHNHVQISDGGDELELRAGSDTHQHVVGVRSDDGATRIQLIALDLPRQIKTHDSEDRE